MILAIETSCDDSAVALLNSDGHVIVSQISSQTELHKKYGGIVPEIASRKHLITLPLLLRSLLEDNNLNLKDLKAVAVTYAPGLIGSLLVGVSYAKTLAWMLDIPLIPVDHLEGHLLAPFLDNSEIAFPYLALIASGGHTHLIQARKLGDYKLVGKTMDDAAGEAYDKVAKMLGFEYPGGPLIEKLAACCQEPTIQFPIPLKGKKTLNFSFSGLKTAVRNEATRQEVYSEGRRLRTFEDYLDNPDMTGKSRIANIAASFQKTMEVIFTERMADALKKTQLKQMALTGGVAANTGIRASLKQLALERGVQLFCPKEENCTDNAAMIGYTAVQHLKAGKQYLESVLHLNAKSKSPIGMLDVSRSNSLRGKKY
ncbi:MAG: tRNA (adenosine(37)-N6)-threonylcarbamoyltransferase complex transferase subunit TsaD [SAR324 cluster bacterium]|nr:tRNA (adenosine(37)-N6)-threonylcarbamoyltransferase complex transferase subunit TsaD [SAR324 cluster bacterium]